MVVNESYALLLQPRIRLLDGITKGRRKIHKERNYLRGKVLEHPRGGTYNRDERSVSNEQGVREGPAIEVATQLESKQPHRSWRSYRS